MICLISIMLVCQMLQFIGNMVLREKLKAKLKVEELRECGCRHYPYVVEWCKHHEAEAIRAMTKEGNL